MLCKEDLYLFYVLFQATAVDVKSTVSETAGHVIDHEVQMNHQMQGLQFAMIQVRLLKPIAGFAGYNTEMRELASVISRVLPEVCFNHVTCTIGHLHA